MSMRILFNGAVLVRPGGASRVDASAMVNAGLGGIGTVGLIGEADAGEPNSINVFSDPDLASAYFKSGPLADMARVAFQPANDPRIPGGASKIVCVKTNQSKQASLVLNGTGVGSGTTAASGPGPYNLEPSQGLKLSVDGTHTITVSFTATAATKLGSGATYSSPSGKTLLIKVDGGETQTYTNAGGSNATAVAGEINAQIRGLQAVVNGTEVDLRSDTRGTNSLITIVAGGTGEACFGQADGSSSPGTGNVANIDAVTAAEADSIISTALGVYGTASGNPVTVTSVLTGTGSSIQFQDPTPTVEATAFGFDHALHSGAAAVSCLTLTSNIYGVDANKISAQISDSGGGKVVALTYQDSLVLKQESSGILGAGGELTVDYTGASATALLTVTATQLTVTLSGGSGGNHLQGDGSYDIAVPFATYKTLTDVINFINLQTGYAAVAVTTNPLTFNSTDLDYVTNASCKSALLPVYAKLFRVAQWIDNNSALVTEVRDPTNHVVPVAVSATYLSGGVRDTGSANSDWQAALDALKAFRVNEVVPLISANLPSPSMATFTSVAAATADHATLMSSTKGKSEREAYIGMAGNKSAILAEAGLLNRCDACLVAQKITVLDSTSTLVEQPEYALAVAAAGMRAGANLGEPLTWKYLNSYNLTQDASWSPANDGDDMILGGVMIAEQVPNQGFRIVKGITTYTRQDNDAYTEESVVMGWKNVVYELRTFLENLFTGTKVSISNLTSFKSEAEAKLNQLRDAGQIVDSVLADGSILKAYRNLKVSAVNDTVTLSVTVSPVEGINFILNNVFLVPATISL